MSSGRAIASPVIQSLQDKSLVPPFPQTHNKLIAGTQLGRYLIEAELRRGATAVVYRACDATLERLVALKAINQQVQSQTVARGWLLREARLAGG